MHGRWAMELRDEGCFDDQLISVQSSAGSILTFPHKRRSLVTVESSHEATAKCCELHTTLVADMRS